MNIFKHGLFSFQYFSHKVLRWTVVPFAFLIIYILNLNLVLNSSGLIYFVLFIIQCLFYAIVLFGWAIKNLTVKVKFIFLPYYLFFMNYSIILGYFRFLSGKHTVNWEKAKRA